MPSISEIAKLAEAEAAGIGHGRTFSSPMHDWSFLPDLEREAALAQKTKETPSISEIAKLAEAEAAKYAPKAPARESVSRRFVGPTSEDQIVSRESLGLKYPSFIGELDGIWRHPFENTNVSEEALSLMSGAASFVPNAVRGVRKNTNAFLGKVLPDNVHEFMGKMLSPENPANWQGPLAMPSLLYGRSKFLDKALDNVKQINDEVQTFARDAAYRKGGFAGGLTHDVIRGAEDTLGNLIAWKSVGLEYGKGGIVKNLASLPAKTRKVVQTLQAVGKGLSQAGIMTSTHEAESGKDFAKNFLVSSLYMMTPAFSRHFGRIAPFIDIATNGAISTARFKGVMDAAEKMAVQSGHPERAKAYKWAAALQMFGSDIIMGAMTRSFNDPRTGKTVNPPPSVKDAAGKYSEFNKHVLDLTSTLKSVAETPNARENEWISSMVGRIERANRRGEYDVAKSLQKELDDGIATIRGAKSNLDFTEVSDMQVGGDRYTEFSKDEIGKMLDDEIAAFNRNNENGDTEAARANQVKINDLTTAYNRAEGKLGSADLMNESELKRISGPETIPPPLPTGGIGDAGRYQGEQVASAKRDMASPRDIQLFSHTGTDTLNARRVADTVRQAPETIPAPGSESLAKSLEQAMSGGAGFGERVSETIPAPGEATQTTSEPKLPEGPPVDVPISDIRVMEQIPNFKHDSDPVTGVVKKNQLHGEYQEVPWRPIILWERPDWKIEVASGRHRLDLAKRNGLKTIKSHIYKASDGWTKEDMMALDAMDNIRDGKGDFYDFYAYFKNSPHTEADAREAGLLSSVKARDAFALAKRGASNLHALFENGKINATKAAAIANGAPNDKALQALGIKKAKTMNADEILAFLQSAGRRKRVAESTGDLFGFDDSALRDDAKMAEIAVAHQKRIRKEISTLVNIRTLSGKEASEIAKQYGINVKDPEAIKRKIVELRKVEEHWKNWYKNELYDQVASEAGVELAKQSPPTEASEPTTPPKKSESPLNKSAQVAVGGGELFSENPAKPEPSPPPKPESIPKPGSKPVKAKSSLPITVYRGELPEIGKGKQLSGVRDIGNLMGLPDKRPLAPFKYFTVNKDDAKHYAERDQQILDEYIRREGDEEKGRKMFESLHGHSPRQGKVRAEKINPKRVFDMTKMRTIADQFMMTELVAKELGYDLPENWRWKDVPKAVNDELDRYGLLLHGKTDPTWMYFKNKISMTESELVSRGKREKLKEHIAGTLFAEWLVKHGYDAVAMMHDTQNGPTKHILVLDKDFAYEGSKPAAEPKAKPAKPVKPTKRKESPPPIPREATDEVTDLRSIGEERGQSGSIPNPAGGIKTILGNLVNPEQIKRRWKAAAKARRVREKIHNEKEGNLQRAKEYYEDAILLRETAINNVVNKAKNELKKDGKVGVVLKKQKRAISSEVVRDLGRVFLEEEVTLTMRDGRKEVYSEKDFDQMSVQELRQLADEAGIGWKGVRTKAGLATRIKAAAESTKMTPAEFADKYDMDNESRKQLQRLQDITDMATVDIVNALREAGMNVRGTAFSMTDDYSRRLYMRILSPWAFKANAQRKQEAIDYTVQALKQSIRRVQNNARGVEKRAIANGKRVDMIRFLQDGNPRHLGNISDAEKDTAYAVKSLYDSLGVAVESIARDPDSGSVEILGHADGTITAAKYIIDSMLNPKKYEKGITRTMTGLGNENDALMHRHLKRVYRILFKPIKDAPLIYSISRESQMNIARRLAVLSDVARQGELVANTKLEAENLFGGDAVRLGNSQDLNARVTDADRTKFGLLAGKWTTKQVAKYLGGNVKPSTRAQATFEWLLDSPIAKGLSKVAGVQRAIAIMRAAAIMRDKISNVFGFGMMAGDSLRPEFAKAYAANEKQIARFVKAVIMKDHKTIAELRQHFAKYADMGLYTANQSSMTAEVNNLLGKGIVGRIWNSPFKARALFADMSAKVAGYEARLAFLKKHKAHRLKSGELTEADLEEMALDHVRKTYDNREAVPDTFKKIASQGFVRDFMTFMYSSTRAGMNSIIERVVDMRDPDIPANENALQLMMLAMGMSMQGLVASETLEGGKKVAEWMVKLSSYLYGLKIKNPKVMPKDVEDAIRFMGPEFYTRDQMAVLMDDNKNIYRAVFSGTISPFAIISDLPLGYLDAGNIRGLNDKKQYAYNALFGGSPPMLINTIQHIMDNSKRGYKELLEQKKFAEEFASKALDDKARELAIEVIEERQDKVVSDAFSKLLTDLVTDVGGWYGRMLTQSKKTKQYTEYLKTALSEVKVRGGKPKEVAKGFGPQPGIDPSKYVPSRTVRETIASGVNIYNLTAFRPNDIRYMIYYRARSLRRKIGEVGTGELNARRSLTEKQRRDIQKQRLGKMLDWAFHAKKLLTVTGNKRVKYTMRDALAKAGFPDWQTAYIIDGMQNYKPPKRSTSLIPKIPSMPKTTIKVPRP